MTAKRDIGGFNSGADGAGQAYTTEIRESLQALWALLGGNALDVAGINILTANLAVSEGFTAYTDGLLVNIVPANSNTGAVTLNLGPGAKQVRRNDGSAAQAGDLVAGSLQPVIFLAANDHFRLVTSTGQSNVTVQGGIHLFRSLPTRLASPVPETTAETDLMSRVRQASFATSRIVVEGQISRKHGTGVDDDDGLTIALFVDGVSQQTVTDAVYSDAVQATSFSFEYAPGDASAHSYAIRATSTIGAAYHESSTYMVLSEFSPNG